MAYTSYNMLQGEQWRLKVLDGKLWALGCLDLRVAVPTHSLLGRRGCKSRGWLEGGCGEVVGSPFPQDLGAGTGQVCVQVL